MCPDETEGFLENRAKKKKKQDIWQKEKYR